MITVGAYIVRAVLLLAFLGLVVLCIMFWLWKRKSEDDRIAFDQVLNQRSVRTYYSPREYADECDRRERRKRG